MKRNRAVIVSVACGVLCAACVFAYQQSVRGEADQARAEALQRYGGEQLEVCVAKRDIAAGETIDAASVETRLWVADLLPDQAITSLSSITGKQATSPILRGEVLSQHRFDRLSSDLQVPEGLVAVSVPAKDVQAVGGAVGQGSRVDMYASGDTSTDAIARNVLVLATSTASSTRSDAAMSWLTLALDPASVQEVIAVSQRAELYFSLPADGGKGKD